MYFDTHAHYDDKSFDDDRNSVLSELNTHNVSFVINPGCDTVSSEAAMRLSEQYGFVYFAAGIHPEEINTLVRESLDNIRRMASHKKCVAIGEIGLDYYWDDTHKDEQKALFTSQLCLAQELNKPVIIHDREAHKDCLDIIQKFPELTGVFHCFSGSPEMAEILLRRGWYLGFDGPVTYKNSRKAAEVLRMCPIDRVLIETDSPYLSPVPNRGKRNDSSNLKYICDKIAEIKNISSKTVEEKTTQNALRLFIHTDN